MVCNARSCRIRSFVLCLFQAEDGIRDRVRSRGLGDVYKRQGLPVSPGCEGLNEALNPYELNWVSLA